jgi:hypothetical protein
MSKHTPGPWTVGDSGGYLNQMKIEPAIGVVYGAGEEIQANAHLIAAAPELLEALQELKEELFQHAEGNYLRPFLDKAEAAIAKAKGE